MRASCRLPGLILLAATSCAGPHGESHGFDPAKVPSVVIGRSTRAEVLTALGQPARSERNAQGETWVYEVREKNANYDRLMGGAAAGSAIAGAFVPFAGLVGSGLGLANAAVGDTGHPPDTTSLAVSYGPDGVVRDCVVTSTAPVAIGPSAAKIVDCARP